MIIVDAMQNIAPNALQRGRDYRRWAWLQRRAETDRSAPPAMSSLPDNLLGRVAIVFGSIELVTESPPHLPQRAPYTWRSLADAQRLARWQLDCYQRLADENERIHLLQTRQDLDETLDSWQAEDDMAGRTQGIVPLLQGSAAISDAAQLEEWLEGGVRIVALAGSDFEPGDLSRFDLDLLEALADAKLLLDIAGLSERAASSAVERCESGIIASHCAPRRFGEHPHCLPDRIILQLAERGGVMGIMLYNQLLRRDWHASDPKRQVRLAHWVDAVDYVCQLTGSAAHVGLGSDIDGGYAYSGTPAEMDTSCDLWLLREALRERGFDDEDAAAILGGNMLRQLRESLPDG